MSVSVKVTLFVIFAATFTQHRNGLRSPYRLTIFNKGEQMATIEDFRKIELIVAQIKEVKEHPNADRLYVIKVDTGKEERQVVAGIRLAYPAKEALIGRRIILVNNLDPAIIRGEQSNGMILAASDENGISVLSPDRDVALGSIVK